MNNVGSLHLALTAAVALVCCVPLGLLGRSSAESKVRGPEPSMFGVDTIPAFMASLLAKLLFASVLFFVPSLVLLYVLGQEPRADLDMRVWVFASLAGVGFGKWIRWQHWRKTQDFT
jgi:hypothetical protein